MFFNSEELSTSCDVKNVCDRLVSTLLHSMEINGSCELQEFKNFKEAVGSNKHFQIHTDTVL